MMQKMKTPKIGLAKYLLIFPVAFALMFLSTAATSAYFDVEKVAVVETVEDDDRVYDFVENRPYFPGGDAAMMQWLSRNMLYPAEAAAQGIQGRVVVRFIVERNGSISDAQIVHSSDNSYLDAEAIRTVQAMPNWQPGRNDSGEIVRSRFTLPVIFRIQ